MRAVLVIAWREIRQGLRNRWVIGASVLLAVFGLCLAFLGSAPVGSVGASDLAVTVVSLSSLGIFLLPLIALLLAYDALVGEFERGTMLLLLTYPVTRWQIVLGKFVGHVAILSFATVVGFGVSGLVAAAGGEGTDGAVWRAFGAMIGASVLLGAVFVALGYVISALARERPVAAGLAIALWLLFVVIYDLVLLGALVADREGVVMTEPLFRVLLAINPADVYRMFNLGDLAGAPQITGMAGIGAGAGLGAGVLLPILAAWVVAPLGLAAFLFRRRET